MRKSLSLLFIALLSVSAFAQNTAKPVEYTAYNGQDYMPRLFEPYRADFVFKAKGLGLTLPLFEFSTNIIERQDSWSEEITFSLNSALREKIEDFPEAIYLTSEIDLKTGLLRRVEGQTTMATGEKVRSLHDFTGDQMAFQGWVNGKLLESKTVPLTKKVYPCTLSTVFFSYLPLKEDFAGEFKCLGFDDNDNPQLLKRRLRVIGGETITTDAGTFDCFKLIDETDIEIKAKGKKQAASYRDKYGVVEYISGLRVNTWIDKKTRIPVKSELDFKKLGGRVVVEMKKRNYRYNSNL
jgi:hypothetical protein